MCHSGRRNCQPKFPDEHLHCLFFSNIALLGPEIKRHGACALVKRQEEFSDSLLELKNSLMTASWKNLKFSERKLKIK